MAHAWSLRDGRCSDARCPVVPGRENGTVPLSRSLTSTSIEWHNATYAMGCYCSARASHYEGTVPTFCGGHHAAASSQQNGTITNAENKGETFSIEPRRIESAVVAKTT